MSVKVSITNIDVGKKLGKNAQRVVNSSITEYTMDLLRVATLRTPVDEGNLETSGTKRIQASDNEVTGTVSFKAMNRGYNYAIKMHNDSYRLGALSQAKSSRGVRSKYYTGSFKVGSGYLEDTALKCKTGYERDLKYKLGTKLGR